MLRDGVPVEYKRADGSIAGDHARLIDFDDAKANDWLVVNQFTVIEGQHNRRPDIVVFVNGLPLGVVELKNAADEDATIWTAFNQLQTYKQQIGSLFHYNEVLVVSDGTNARIGSLTANQEWFKVWRTIDGEGDAPRISLELDVLVRGVFEPSRFLDLLQHFIVFEEDTDSGRLHKIIAGYHQFHAVNAAVEETVRASGMGATDRSKGGKPGDRRAGVVWHTQGSGKSFSMLFYAARIVRHPVMQNPTLVMLTDRNDLDDQLFGQFQRCHELLRQMPVQADDREHLRRLLQVASGGVVFTTIQKFMPEKGEKMLALSLRRNIVVIADEAHRSQYDLIDGLARNLRDALPSASFIGFTGTPIEQNDANTRAIFGEYISIYDIQRAVADGATVPIYYESRIAKLALNQAALPKIDEEFDEITEGEEDAKKQKLKTKWAALEALVGDPKRIAIIAADLVQHYERRLEAMDGKAMIVCMSRRICVDLYEAIIKLRPDWASAKDDDTEAEKKQACVVKIVMTGSAEDGPDWQPHIRNKPRRRELATRFKDSKDPFRIVIVRDMWLTGFDAPCLHTMYADKPMRGHGLMQAIARVNRVFRDKPGGLVVDYLGLADQLKQALATYTQSGGKGDPSIDTAQAIALMQEKHEVACAARTLRPLRRHCRSVRRQNRSLPPSRFPRPAMIEPSPDELRRNPGSSLTCPARCGSPDGKKSFCEICGARSESMSMMSIKEIEHEHGPFGTDRAMAQSTGAADAVLAAEFLALRELLNLPANWNGIVALGDHIANQAHRIVHRTDLFGNCPAVLAQHFPPIPPPPAAP